MRGSFYPALVKFYRDYGHLALVAQGERPQSADINTIPPLAGDSRAMGEVLTPSGKSRNYAATPAHAGWANRVTRTDTLNFTDVILAFGVVLQGG